MRRISFSRGSLHWLPRFLHLHWFQVATTCVFIKYFSSQSCSSGHLDAGRNTCWRRTHHLAQHFFMLICRPSTSHPHVPSQRNTPNWVSTDRRLGHTGYDLESRGPEWGVPSSSSGGWRQEPRGEVGDLLPPSAGWEPGPRAQTHQQPLWDTRVCSRPSLHLLPCPPHSSRAQSAGWQHTWGECLVNRQRGPLIILIWLSDYVVVRRKINYPRETGFRDSSWCFVLITVICLLLCLCR